MEVLEEPNEIQHLSAGTSGFPEGKELEGRFEVPKVPLNVWHEAWYIEVVYYKLPDVRECGRITQRAWAKHFRIEMVGGIVVRADTKPLDERKQTELVSFGMA